VQLVSSSTYQTVKAHTVGDASFGFGVALGGIGVRSVQNTNVKRFSQELRATATGLAGDFLDIQVGGYYTHENDSNAIPGFPVLNPVTGAEVPFPNIATASILSKYTEFSGFANATLHFTPKFDVLVGGRYSHIDQDYAQDYRGLIIPGGVMVASGSDKKGVATFLVTPRYKVSDNVMVYARVASGYRAGGPNAPGIGAPLTFAPDKLTSYEVGIKLATDDRKFTYDAAVFRTDWNDVQIQTSNAGFNFFVNGGKARSSGGEIVLGYHPIAGLNFGATFAYTNARLTEDALAAGGKAGDRMPYVPKVSVSLSGQYDFSLGGDLGATIGGSLNRTGSRFSNYSGKAAHKLDGYSTVNLNTGLTYQGWSLSVFAKNLTNERGILALGSLGLTPASNPFIEAVIAPRTIGAEVAVKF
jgi:iron complex outermembrane receptor protein